MIALVQRVKHARVTVDDRETGAIKEGILILLGVHTTDTEDLIPWLAAKCANLRIFPDIEGRMNRSVVDHGGSILVVSQFTLYGNAEKGNRPSFIESARNRSHNSTEIPKSSTPTPDPATSGFWPYRYAGFTVNVICSMGTSGVSSSARP